MGVIVNILLRILLALGTGFASTIGRYLAQKVERLHARARTANRSSSSNTSADGN